MFDTTVTADALAESLGRAGLAGEVLLMRAGAKLEGDMPMRPLWDRQDHRGQFGRLPAAVDIDWSLR